MRGFGWALGVMGLLALASACGGGGSSGTEPAVNNVAGSSGMKICDYGCTCTNGLSGKFDCDTNQCDCAACPAFDPPEPAPFEACGGDPTGVWRLAGYEQGPFVLSVTSTNGAVTTCQGQTTQPSKPNDFLLELKASGDAALHYDLPSQSFEVVESCVAGLGLSCSSLTAFDCTRRECGLCECTSGARAGDVGELTWSKDGGKLTLIGEQASNLDFCVKGDTMTYRAAPAADISTLERLYRAGQPVVCAERGPDDCAKGGTCKLGQCVGTGSCNEAATEATCAKFQDCHWDAASCYGNVDFHCSLTDYVNAIPGCVLSKTPPKCVGTPLKCEVQPGCEAAGCLIGPACRGGKHDCFVDDKAVPGCVCDIGCTGTFDCADLTTPTSCQEAGYPEGAFDPCKWSTTACVATATPCEELSLNQCETTLGCVLEAQ